MKYFNSTLVADYILRQTLEENKKHWGKINVFDNYTSLNNLKDENCVSKA